MSIPEDFPREPDPSALSGAQPKLAVRLVDGKYISGYTAEERAERHDMCADLVLQLARYYQRKRSERPERTKEELLTLIAEALPAKNWGLSRAEIEWCVLRLTAEVVDEK